MTPTVGIPRALFYYYHYPLWKTFFQCLGVQTVLSPKTNKNILEQGLKQTVDEACLPVKLFHGHLGALQDKVDCLFVPRIVSVERRAYICPKFMGLPDMIAANLTDLPPVMSVTIDLTKNDDNYRKAMFEVGRLFTKNNSRIGQAWKEATDRYRAYRNICCQGFLPEEAIEYMENGDRPPCKTSGLQVAVLGHGYNIYDGHTSMDLIGKLCRMGATVVTADMVPQNIIDEETKDLPKRMFWTLGKKVMGAMKYYIRTKQVKGLIHMASFGCGPDSLVGELVERYARREAKLPYLVLTVDEHTGEAGINTRLEAFMDMVQWREAR